MKDILRRIRRGEVQLFIPIAQQHIDIVFTLVREKYPEEQAITVSKKILSRLYEDIVNKYRWQDPERFVSRSLTRSCQAHKIEWHHSQTGNMKAPPQVERMLFASLSRNLKRKSNRNLAAASVIGICIIVTVCMVLIMFSGNKAGPEEGETLYQAFTKPSLIYEEDIAVRYAMKVGYHKIENISQLGREGMGISYISPDDEYFIRIFKQGKLIDTINISKGFRLICGDLDQEYLITASDTRIEKIDLQGGMLAERDVDNHFICFSANMQYGLTKNNGSYQIIDFSTLETKGNYTDDIIGVSNSGEAVFINYDLYRQIKKDYKIAQTTLLADDTIITVFNDGLVLRHDTEKVIWKRQIDLGGVSNGDMARRIIMAGVMQNDDKITVVFENGVVTAFQSFELNQGDKLLDLDDTQVLGSPQGCQPQVIGEGNAFVLYTSSVETGDVIRMIETSSVPMKEVFVSDQSADKINIEGKASSYYVYVHGGSRVKIFKVGLS